MKNKIFAYVVLGLNVVAAWVSWWVLAGAIFGTMRHIWLYPIIALGLWAIVFTLSTIFVKNKIYIYGSYLAGAVGFPIFFGFGLSILGVALAVLMFVLTEIQAKKEAVRGVSINFYLLVSHTLKYFVTAICIVIAVAYYFSITDKAPTTPTFLETKTLQAEMDWGLRAAGLVLPDDKKAMINDINNNVTVDEFLSQNFVKPELADAVTNNADVAANNATDTTKLIGSAAAMKIQEEMLAKSKRDLSKQLGVNVVGEQPMKNVLMAYIDKSERSFFDYSGTDKFYVPIILAFGLFLTARILGTAVDLVLGLFILLLIKLLQNSGAISLDKEQREVAIIDYSI